jgi:hypothetical protein
MGKLGHPEIGSELPPTVGYTIRNVGGSLLPIIRENVSFLSLRRNEKDR